MTVRARRLTVLGVLSRDIDREIAQPGDTSAKLPCLVRITPDPELTSHHFADRPCGRVHNRKK
ncbi:hypothetical protein DIZ27_05330 [Streptomyces sp. NWU339]|nr:hypothetical protein DIZ27_05330 [Streptomyces sp. NWU339]